MGFVSFITPKAQLGIMQLINRLEVKFEIGWRSSKQKPYSGLWCTKNKSRKQNCLVMESITPRCAKASLGNFELTQGMYQVNKFG